MNKVTKNIAALIAFGIGTTTISFAQVTQQKIGINPTLINPNAALEIESTAKGLLMPRLALTATNNFAPLTAHVQGMTVYNTVTSGSAPNNVTPGYYYNDGTQWVRVATGADAKTEPWRIQTTTNEATANTDHIYQLGRVGVGDFSGAFPVGYLPKMMEVKGDFKAQVSAGGNAYGMEIDSPLIPGTQTAANYWFGSLGNYRVNLVHSTAAVLSAGLIGATGHESIIAVDDNRVTLGSRYNSLLSKSEIRSEKTGNFYIEAYNNSALDFGSSVALQDDGLRLVHSTTEGDGPNWLANSNWSEILLRKDEGVKFEFKSVTGTTKGAYWFPLTTGTDGQVMTRVGTLGKTEWRSPSTLFTEVDGVIGNEVTNATANGGLTRAGAGTAASPYTLGLTPGSATGNVMTWNGTAWNPAAPVVITANNGLTKNLNEIELGGTLNRTTTIATVNSGTTHPLNITGLPTTGAATDNIVVSSTGGQLKTISTANLVQEPWKVIGSAAPGTPATLNTENIYQMGNVSIGKTTATSFTVGTAPTQQTINPKLHVEGDISTTGKVWTTNSVYADYVFEKYFNGSSKINPNYEFKSLNYVRDFIKANNHLPGVESINDLAKAENGYTFDITKLTVQSLEKIEELYLHTIEQQDKIDQQQSEIEKLKKDAENTQQRLEKLEKLLINNM